MIANPAHADSRQPGVPRLGAEVDFSVEKDDSRFEVQVEVRVKKDGGASKSGTIRMR